jgi:hypothetical protein
VRFSQLYQRATPHIERANNIDYHVILGDSEASGGTATEPVDWPAEYSTADYTNAQILFKNDRTSESASLRFLPYSVRTPINRAPGYEDVITSSGPYGVGFDNSYMYYVSQNYRKPICLQKWGLGGTRLLSEWAPTGSMFTSFRDYYCLPAGSKGRELGYTGFLYKTAMISLGINDVVTANWNQANFIAAIPVFVANVRAAVGNPNLPIYWFQVRSDLYLAPSGLYTQTNVNQARAALTNCASGGSTPITGFNLLDYESVTTTLADGVHRDADSNDLIGLDLAEQFEDL